MLFSARTTIQLLIVLGAAIGSRGYSYYDEDDLSSRGLGLSDYEPEYSRSYIDESAFVLSARDLRSLGVRAEDISHVLVIRGKDPKQPSSSDHEGMLKWHQEMHKITTENVNTKQKELDAAKQIPNYEHGIKNAKNLHKSAKEIMEYHADSIKDYKNILGHHWSPPWMGGGSSL